MYICIHSQYPISQKNNFRVPLVTFSWEVRLGPKFVLGGLDSAIDPSFCSGGTSDGSWIGRIGFFLACSLICLSWCYCCLYFFAFPDVFVLVCRLLWWDQSYFGVPWPFSKTLLSGQPEHVFGQGGSHRILDSTLVPLLRWAPTIEPTPLKMSLYFGQGRLFLGYSEPKHARQ